MGTGRLRFSNGAMRMRVRGWGRAGCREQQLRLLATALSLPPSLFKNSFFLKDPKRWKAGLVSPSTNNPTHFRSDHSTCAPDGPGLLQPTVQL